MPAPHGWRAGRGTEEDLPFSRSRAGSETCTVRAGRGHLSSGWFGGEELRFHGQSSRTCADGALCELATWWHGRLQVVWEVLLQEHPLRMGALS